MTTPDQTLAAGADGVNLERSAIHLPREQRVAAVLELLEGAISATLAVLGG